MALAGQRQLESGPDRRVVFNEENAGHLVIILATSYSSHHVMRLLPEVYVTA
ncbi:hypothetical protein Psi01_21530 [Planobispora siamensis]|uniref:Uncharacterized protein n=1 Tax=Planobispora siamensis TaxID=936338 RepID=A0A8J3SCC4_9ACTN|nr:hypothetical protein Psi01_21530 [Planobispora siamensis]